MKWFFLPGETLVKMALAALFAVNILPWFLSALFILGSLAALFIFRKNKVFYQDSFSLNPDLMLAPISGKVRSVRKEKDGAESSWVVEASIPLWEPCGLYLPFDGRFEEVDAAEKARKRDIRRLLFTNKPDRYNLTLQSKAGVVAGIKLMKSFWGLGPRLYVRSGDRGRALACFGCLPGGRVEMKLPGGSKVMVGPGDKLKAGETAVAGF